MVYRTTEQKKIFFRPISMLLHSALNPLSKLKTKEKTMTHIHKTIRYFLCGAFLNPILLASCGPAAFHQPTRNNLQSAQEPHVLRKGPWFEGWYARATNLNNNGSLAIIVGTHVAKGSAPQPGKAVPLPGYIGILQSDGDQKPTRSWTFFPKATTITKAGQPVETDPNLFDENDSAFQWRSDDPAITARFENNQIFIAIPGELEVSMEFGAAKSWDQTQPHSWPRLPLGPEGYLAGLPVPLHWYVKSLNSPGSYTLKTWQDNRLITEASEASAVHLEKNWGQVFPKSWNWLQAHSNTDDAQIVLGGGIVDLGRGYNLPHFDLSAWLGGYRSPTESWDIRFSDPGTNISVTEDSCLGKFKFTARLPTMEVEIEAIAPPNTFGPVAVPTESGFVADFGAESFSSTITVNTYRKGLTGKRLTDSRTFRNGALEFGAGSYRKVCK